MEPNHASNFRSYPHRARAINNRPMPIKKYNVHRPVLQQLVDFSSVHKPGLCGSMHDGVLFTMDTLAHAACKPTS
jgi:hypothetical protein